MATTDPLYGKKQVLKVGATSTPAVITNLTSNGITKSRDTRDVTTKQSPNDWREVRVSYKNGEISFEGIYTTEDASVNAYAELDTLFNAGTEVFWELGTGDVGTRKETGKGYITSLDQDAPQDDNATFSGTITLTGDPTVGTYA